MSLSNIVRSFGSLAFIDNSTSKILKRQNQLIVQVLQDTDKGNRQRDRESLVSYIQVFLDTSMNLRALSSWDYKETIEPLLTHVIEAVGNFSFNQERDLKFVKQYITILKALAKANMFYESESEELLPLWTHFIAKTSKILV